MLARSWTPCVRKGAGTLLCIVHTPADSRPLSALPLYSASFSRRRESRAPAYAFFRPHTCAEIPISAQLKQESLPANRTDHPHPLIQLSGGPQHEGIRAGLGSRTDSRTWLDAGWERGGATFQQLTLDRFNHFLHRNVQQTRWRLFAELAMSGVTGLAIAGLLQDH